MITKDARSLAPAAQEDLRRRVVKAVEGGLKQTKAAEVFGVARGTVNRWVRLRVSQAGLRTIDKKGIDAVLAEMRARGEDV